MKCQDVQRTISAKEGCGQDASFYEASQATVFQESTQMYDQSTGWKVHWDGLQVQQPCKSRVPSEMPTECK